MLFWKQKANVKWYRDEDSNTKFLHQTVKERECNNSHDIELEAVHYYETLFKAGTTSQYHSILQYIPALVSDVDNDILLAMPELQEVK